MPKPRGRRTLFDPSTLPVIRKLKDEGLTDAEIAGYLGIGYSTMTHWKVSNPDFRNAISRDDTAATKAVERAMYRRATGMELPKVKITHHAAMIDGRITDQRVIKTRYKEEIAPDVRAGEYWLNNRAKDRWGPDAASQDASTIAKEEANVAAFLGLVKGKGGDK